MAMDIGTYGIRRDPRLGRTPGTSNQESLLQANQNAELDSVSLEPVGMPSWLEGNPTTMTSAHREGACGADAE